jgi:protein-S-isoprenylcysteine O-methyltransferase Ste14
MWLLLKNLLYTLVLPATFAIYLPLLIVEEGTPASLGSIIASMPFFVVGGGVFTWCVWEFATVGRGTPAPVDAPKRLVVEGLYRYHRNPLYAGLFLVMLGWVILFLSKRLAVYVALAFVGFHLFVVLYEEPGLRLKFGNEYAAYCHQTGRWVPRWRRSQA